MGSKRSSGTTGLLARDCGDWEQWGTVALWPLAPCPPPLGRRRGCNFPGHGNGWTRPSWTQWLGQSTWASPGDWLGSAASWEEVRHCFGGCVGPLELRTMQGTVGARSSPPTIGNLFIALMTPRWIHLETDLLMSGDRAGTAPREACRASSPGGAKGVWSETGRAGK